MHRFASLGHSESDSIASRPWILQESAGGFFIDASGTKGETADQNTSAMIADAVPIQQRLALTRSIA